MIRLSSVLLTLLIFTFSFAASTPFGLTRIPYDGRSTDTMEATFRYSLEEFSRTDNLRIDASSSVVLNGARPGLVTVRINMITSNGTSVPRSVTPIPAADFTDGIFQPAPDYVAVDVTVVVSQIAKLGTLTPETIVADLFVTPGAELTGYGQEIPKGTAKGAKVHYWSMVCEPTDVSIRHGSASQHTITVATAAEPAKDLVTANPDWTKDGVFTIPKSFFEDGQAPMMLFTTFVATEAVTAASSVLAYTRASHAIEISGTTDQEVAFPAFRGCMMEAVHTFDENHRADDLLYITYSGPEESEIRHRYAIFDGANESYGTVSNWSDDFAQTITQDINKGDTVRFEVTMNSELPPSHLGFNKKAVINIHSILTKDITEIENGETKTFSLAANEVVKHAVDFTHQDVRDNDGTNVNVVAQLRMVNNHKLSLCGARAEIQHMTCTPESTDTYTDVTVTNLDGTQKVSAVQLVAPHSTISGEWFFHSTNTEATFAKGQLLVGALHTPAANNETETFDVINTSADGRGMIYFKFDIPKAVKSVNGKIPDRDLIVSVNTGFDSNTEIRMFASQSHMMPDAIYNDYSASGYHHVLFHNKDHDLDMTKPVYVGIHAPTMLSVSAMLMDVDTEEVEDGGIMDETLTSAGRDHIIGYFETNNTFTGVPHMAYCSLMATNLEGCDDDCQIQLSIAATHTDLFDSENAQDMAVIGFKDSDVHEFVDTEHNATNGHLFYGVRVVSATGKTTLPDWSFTAVLRCGTHPVEKILNGSQELASEVFALPAPEFHNGHDYRIPFMALVPDTDGFGDSYEIQIDTVLNNDNDMIAPIHVVMCNGDIPITYHLHSEYCKEVLISNSSTRVNGRITTRIQRIHDVVSHYRGNTYIAVYMPLTDWSRCKECTVPKFQWTYRTARDMNVDNVNYVDVVFPGNNKTIYYAGAFDDDLMGGNDEYLVLHTSFTHLGMIAAAPHTIRICATTGSAENVKPLHSDSISNCVTRNYPQDFIHNENTMQASFPITLSRDQGLQYYYVTANATYNDASMASTRVQGTWRSTVIRPIPISSSHTYTFPAASMAHSMLAFAVPTPLQGGPTGEFTITATPIVPPAHANDAHAFFEQEITMAVAHGFIPDGEQGDGDNSKEYVFKGLGIAAIELQPADFQPISNVPWIVAIRPIRMIDPAHGLTVRVEAFAKHELNMVDAPDYTIHSQLTAVGIPTNSMNMAVDTQFEIAPCHTTTKVQVWASASEPYIAVTNPVNVDDLGVVSGNEAHYFNLAGESEHFSAGAYTFVTMRPSNGDFEFTFRPDALYHGVPNAHFGYTVDAKDATSAKIIVPAAKHITDAKYEVYYKDNNNLNWKATCGITYGRLLDSAMSVDNENIILYVTLPTANVDPIREIGVVVRSPSAGWVRAYLPYVPGKNVVDINMVKIVCGVVGGIIGLILIAGAAFLIIRYLQTRNYIKGYSALLDSEGDAIDAEARGPAPATGPAPEPMPAPEIIGDVDI